MITKCYVLLVMTSLIIGGCAQGIKNEETSSFKTLKIKAPYPKPNTVEMKGGMWLLVKPLSATYYNKADPSETYSIEVPAGFVMDLASIPKPLRILTGKYHDGSPSLYYVTVYLCANNVSSPIGRSEYALTFF